VSDVATAANAARAVRAFHVLRTYLVRAGHLAVAVPETPDTSEAALHTVCREIWGLRLTAAWAHRLVHPGERAALTRRTAVFVTADPASGDVRHALAAMAEGVPVVAPADASAAGILGDGALLLPAGAGTTLIAEAVAELLRDEARRSRLAAAATRAVERFAPERVAPAWRAALAA
jgi:glycosyltransferase involved in cell wall biosynthesis